MTGTESRGRQRAGISGIDNPPPQRTKLTCFGHGARSGHGRGCAVEPVAGTGPVPTAGPVSPVIPAKDRPKLGQAGDEMMVGDNGFAGASAAE